MFRIFYDLAVILLTVFCLPKYLWEMLGKGKHRRSFLAKLGWKLPSVEIPLNGRMRIWIHAVSVGETKAVAPLIETIGHHYPQSTIIVSTTSETGLEEAKRLLGNRAQYLYLPIDFSWTIRRLVRHIRPDLLVLVESDFWYNLISYNQKVILVNGKLSERSLSRFLRLPSLTRRLFGGISLFCVQNVEYARRFSLLGVPPSKIVVTGNLKWDQRISLISREEWKQKLGIQEGEVVITIGCTHPNEEEVLLPIVRRISKGTIFLAPRHPERFGTVARFLQEQGYQFTRFSTLSSPKKAQIILIDEMGVLPICYQLSHIAIVGGSYVPHVGGHNILEPVAAGAAVLFGPHMEQQQELAQLLTTAGAAKQVPRNQLETILREWTQEQDFAILHSMKQAGAQLISECSGTTQRTFEAITVVLNSMKD